MILPKGWGDILVFLSIEQRNVAFNERLQLAAEIFEEKFVVLGGQQSQNIVVVLLQMLKQMQEDGVRTVAMENMSVSVSGGVFCVEDMTKQLPAKFFQEKILGFKVGVEGGPADVRQGDDLPNGDLAEILGRKQLCKSAENSLPGLSLASVHGVLHTFFKICSVMNYRDVSYVAEIAPFDTILLNMLFNIIVAWDDL